MVIIGDIHGDLGVIYSLIEKLPENSNIIQLGDFGVGFSDINYSDKLYKLNYRLKQKKINVYVCRGNHDDPSYFKGQYVDDYNLKLIPDYSLINIEGKNVLFVGGGISLDRSYRAEGRSYWKEEKVVSNLEVLKNIESVDVVVSHIAPSFCHPSTWNDFVKRWVSVDPSLSIELKEERKILDDVFYFLREERKFKIKNWFYGHFHMTKFFETHNKTKFKVLNVCEILDFH